MSWSTSPDHLRIGLKPHALEQLNRSMSLQVVQITAYQQLLALIANGQGKRWASHVPQALNLGRGLTVLVLLKWWQCGRLTLHLFHFVCASVIVQIPVHCQIPAL